MNSMQSIMVCPSCGQPSLNLFEYSSLMALRRDLGLFTIECPNCLAKISSIHPIPLQLQKEVARKAAEVNAGMGVNCVSSVRDGNAHADVEGGFKGDGAREGDLGEDVREGKLGDGVNDDFNGGPDDGFDDDVSSCSSNSPNCDPSISSDCDPNDNPNNNPNDDSDLGNKCGDVRG